jgi:TatA/E family protein of Tat protein translocase
VFGFERAPIVILFILIIVLIVYGPGKIPEVGAAIGRAMREFRRASSDLQDEIQRGTSPGEQRTYPGATSPTASESRPAPSSEVKPTAGDSKT